MLGIKGSDQSWRWVASGKHAVAKDFFRIGNYFPLAGIFSDWIDKGYRQLTERRHSGQSSCSWRFWARGQAGNELVCGLAKDSSDSFGRPYPLLIVGAGPLPSWEEHWDLLPFACENTWSQLEFISTNRSNALSAFESEIQKIRPPSAEWSRYEAARLAMLDSTQSGDGNQPGTCNLKSLSAQPAERVVCLDIDSNSDILIKAASFCYVLKNKSGVTPCSHFMGGTASRSQLVLFRQPMTHADFLTLWAE